jgi:hypothetical protein
MTKTGNYPMAEGSPIRFHCRQRRILGSPASARDPHARDPHARDPHARDPA